MATADISKTLGFKFNNARENISLAIHLFEKAILLDPLNAHITPAQYDILKKASIFDRAVATHLRALNLSSNSAVVHGTLAGIYFDHGLFDLSIDTARQAIELQPNFAEAHCNLANAFKAKGQTPEAEDCYNTAIRLCPTYAIALNNFANMKCEQGFREEAIGLYLKALQVFPEFRVAHSNLALALHAQNNKCAAIVHYEEAIHLHSSLVDAALSSIGNKLKENDATTGALQCYTYAIEISPALCDAYNNLGCCHKELNQMPAAIDAFRAALNLKPDHHHAYTNLAFCLQIVCDWIDYDNRMKRLIAIVIEELEKNDSVAVHAFDSLLWPMSHEHRKAVATRYANRCIENIQKQQKPTAYTFDQRLTASNRLRIGYMSSGFGSHPISEAMQR